MPPIVFSMQNVGKSYGGGTPVIDDLSLSFYLGAKIGVVGENGAGKSTFLRIMAGVDSDFTGDAKLEGQYTRLLVPQEPRLDPSLTVRGNLELSVAPLKAIVSRYEEVTVRMGEDVTPEEMENLMEEFGRLQETIDAGDLWEIDRHLEIGIAHV